eukprot:CAMPEP_0177609182 /NCGR_PEP_ID=MMETSP0419_2-20121207/18925_1 /TAXON_ID=582737 /ORGANISM="Tetraselmis sp., Strain GSL018" /LENGTH=103 /DNA_ID=CAMNT_0019104035 /DNA_START=207 /DNA_END=515 /DNA_ORIENTATION=-
MLMWSGKTAKERERWKAGEKESDEVRSARAELVSGRGIPPGKSFMWDLIEASTQSACCMQPKNPSKPRRYVVGEPSISAEKFKELLLKRRLAETCSFASGDQA